MDRKRTTYLLLGGSAALLLFAAVAGPHRTAPPPPPPPPLVRTPPPPLPQGQRPRVDVVFALDTTGSMSALLEGAKKKIWEISRFIAQGQPAPELRVGLVAYRDVGDDYVTKFYDLTDDLDAVYQNLSALGAGGGGDGPEHVAKALHEAVNRSSWSQDKSTLRIVYLVGDAPPHTDYNDGYNYRAIAQQAGERGIRINTIRCGGDLTTERFWREIAGRAQGEFASIDQSGGVQVVATPYDDELARLNTELSGTTLAYGSEAAKAEVKAKVAASAAAPASVQADRAGWFGLMRARKGGAEAVSGRGDLVSDLEGKKVKLEEMDKTALPEPMQAMPAAEQQRFVEEKAKQRKVVLERIAEATKKRDEYLRKEAGARPADGFDAKVRATLKKQAADIAVAY